MRLPLLAVLLCACSIAVSGQEEAEASRPVPDPPRFRTSGRSGSERDDTGGTGGNAGAGTGDRSNAIGGTRKIAPAKLRLLRRLTNTGNGALLALSAPLQFRAVGIASFAALRGFMLSSWLSAMGTVILLDATRIWPQWMRRHFRFATTATGRMTLKLLATTIALSSGSVGLSILGTVTLANTIFGWYVHRELALARRPPPPVLHPTIAAPASPPTSSDDEHGVGDDEDVQHAAAHT